MIKAGHGVEFRVSLSSSNFFRDAIEEYSALNPKKGHNGEISCIIGTLMEISSIKG